ncbi:MAG: radical SAM protein [Smithella sp.]|nr:radical SAM protein [Smithella sp.]
MRPLKIFLASLGFRRSVLGVTPPLGIMYIAAYLRQKLNVEIRIVNQKISNMPNDELVKQAKEFGADVVGLSMLTTNAYSLPYITSNLKVALPDALIVIGGPHVSAFGEKSLEGNLADVGVPYEGELAFEALINAYLGGGDTADVPGIFRRDEEGIVTNPGITPLVEDIDSLPFPAYDLIDLEPYWKIQAMTLLMRRKYVGLFSSRGCPFRCIYCHRIFGDSLRIHSAQRVLEEIKFYINNYGVNDFEFYDDIFNHDKKRLFEICGLIEKLGIKVRLSFPNGLRVDELSEDSIDALSDAGMYYCSCPLESGSPRIQKLIGKNLNIRKYLENVKYAASKRIFTFGFMMMGFPTETEKDLKQTLEATCMSKLHAASFYTLTPFPNTKVYDIAVKNNPEKFKNIDYDDKEYSHMKHNFSDIPDEIFFYYQRKANRDFYMNPSRIAKIIRDFPQTRRLPLYIPEYFKRLSKGIFG